MVAVADRVKPKLEIPGFVAVRLGQNVHRNNLMLLSGGITYSPTGRFSVGTGYLYDHASSQTWSTGDDGVDGLISFYGNQHGVDPYLIFCLMSQESKFSRVALSPKGAQGLMQLMPGTAARYGVTNPYDVAQNIEGGTRYLRDLLKMFNVRVDLALAAYNAGEKAVIKYGYTVPPSSETRNYVKLITRRYGASTSKAEAPKTKV